MARATLDPAEFTTAFARFGRTLWVIAAAWVGRADAADVVQETARVAWERRSTFAGAGEVTELRAWLAQIARHTAANWRRRARRWLVALADDDDGVADRLPAAESSPMSSPAAVAATSEFDADALGLSDEVANALAQLSEVARACLLLQVVAGHTFPEIAILLDIPENTAASHARRARLALRAALTAKPAASQSR